MKDKANRRNMPEELVKPDIKEMTPEERQKLVDDIKQARYRRTPGS